ncbi:antA/AntB antirepressor family protein [Nesterenkonia flava]|uniref:AntA/AntB antirepressor family protein n=1 Tax=Nesterenkonia flava TaxID=469799 RepID=A0ABU1FRY9_9MICC|nr:antA/AntB antirepressor family protein [Nesterenkonia flava]MDR5711426.1 antA/AntB antirepressor family protein [Nesterenkonia flava]
MNDLIPIRDHDGQQAVSGRDLHAFLGLGRDYTTWFKKMTEYGFIEGQDFTPIRGRTSEVGGRPSVDHALTLDMAKELSMIQRTERGKQARQYFIECERRANTQQVTAPAELSRLEILQLALESEQARVQAEQELEAARPAVAYVERFVSEDDVVTIKAWAAEMGLTEPKARQLLQEHRIIYPKPLGSRWSQSKQRLEAVHEWRAYANYITWFDLRPQHNAPRHHNGQVRTTLYVRQSHALDLAAKIGLTAAPTQPLKLTA